MNKLVLLFILSVNVPLAGDKKKYLSSKRSLTLKARSVWVRDHLQISLLKLRLSDYVRGNRS